MYWRLALPIFALLALPLAGSVSVADDGTAFTPLIAPVEAAPIQVLTPEQWDAERATRSDPPSPGIQTGIGPGSAMHQGVGSAGYICTAAFLLRDPYTGTYYLSTAGHCLVRDGQDPNPYTGAANADKVDDVIEICVAGCIDNALGIGTYVTIKPKDGIHPVTFAQSGGVGLDFGIIQLPASLHDDLRPDMPMWGGPTGLADDSASASFVVHFGHGSYCCPATGAVASRTPADQGRLSMFQGASDAVFDAIGWSSGGDSGSGVSLGVSGGSDGVSGGMALGVLTHGSYVGNPAASLPLFTGTMLTKGLAMVQEATGLQLELVLAGDPLPASPTATPPQVTTVNLTVTAPTPGSTIDPAVKRVTVKGLAGNGGALDNGTQVQVAIDDTAYGFKSRLPVSGNSSWTATWDLAGVPNGAHTIRARVVDADGTVLDQENVTVTLKKGAGTASQSASKSGTGSAAASGSGSDSGAGSQEDGGPFGLRDGSKGAPALGLPMLAAALALVLWVRRRR